MPWTGEIQDAIDNGLSHQIHTSERRAFRACRRRWNWSYREGYHPIVTPQPLEFGIAFHKAMEKFYEPITWLSPLDVRMSLALVAFKQECDAQLARYKRLNPDPEIEVIDSYRERIALGLRMIRHYCGVVSPVYDQRWTPIRVEVGFEVPVQHEGNQLYCRCPRCWNKFLSHPTSQKFLDQEFVTPDGTTKTAREIGPKTYAWKGLPVTYAGRLDMLAQDEHGRYWIVDWKSTKSIIDEDAQASFLQLDDQVSSYIWALSQYGIECAGFVYVEIKKAVPEPPKALLKIRSGRAYSVDKQALTTYKMFLHEVQMHDNDAWQIGLYDDHLNWLKAEGPIFHQRHQIHKNRHEIENTGKVIALEAMDIINNPRVYPMPGRFSCTTCSYKQPCLGQNMGEDYKYSLDTMFEKQEKPYWEQKPPATE